MLFYILVILICILLLLTFLYLLLHILYISIYSVGDTVLRSIQTFSRLQ